VASVCTVVSSTRTILAVVYSDRRFRSGYVQGGIILHGGFPALTRLNCRILQHRTTRAQQIGTKLDYADTPITFEPSPVHSRRSCDIVRQTAMSADGLIE
jgi:hypothetical protein